jgi:glycosyltransferase involved in cell wall biosynthesis
MAKTVVIQIPCFNEAQTVGETIADLPRALPGVGQVVVLVIDDGSTDNTAQVALKNGADYVVRHRQQRGLAQAFMTGLTTSLALGADVIVNTDADHQYPGRYIPDLIAPVLSGTTDFVVGDRQPGKNVHFSPSKRLLERAGSWVIRILSKTDAQDAASGFRAYSRYAALRLQVHSRYSYTLETLIQAGRERMAIAHVPIETNPALRPSRLHSGILDFILRQSGTIIRSYVLYQPLASFFLVGIPFLVVGALLIVRFLYFYFTGNSGVGRYLQSVSIGGTLALFGMLLISMGLLGDALRANRQVMQDILSQLRDKSHLHTEEEGTEVVGSPLIRSQNEKGH